MHMEWWIQQHGTAEMEQTLLGITSILNLTLAKITGIRSVLCTCRMPPCVSTYLPR